MLQAHYMRTLITLLFVGTLISCSSSSSYKFEHESLSAPITFPDIPTITTSLEGLINASLIKDNITYCLELEPFDSVVSIQTLWSSNLRLNAYDSKTRTSCFNAPNTTYGIDTITTEFMAAVVNFKNEETESASTAAFIIKPKFRLSIEIGFNDLTTPLELRNEQKLKFFSTTDTEPAFTDLFGRLQSGLNSWDVDERWK